MRKWTSRKFLFPLVTAATLVVSDLLGADLDPEIVYGAVIAALGFAGVEGIIDSQYIKESARVEIANAQADAAGAVRAYFSSLAEQRPSGGAFGE